MANKKQSAVPEEPAFTKKQLLRSERYRERRDLLQALLEDKSYTQTEVEQKIHRFMKGKVN